MGNNVRDTTHMHVLHISELCRIASWWTIKAKMSEIVPKLTRGSLFTIDKRLPQ